MARKAHGPISGSELPPGIGYHTPFQHEAFYGNAGWHVQVGRLPSGHGVAEATSAASGRPQRQYFAKPAHAHAWAKEFIA